jgi:chromosome segregation ATPase
LDLSRTSLSTQLSHSLKETAESVIGLMEKQEVKDSENFNNINKSQHDANQGLNKIVDLVNKINAGITDKKLLTENFKDSLGLVEVRIEELDKAIRDQMGFSLKIEELTKQNKELESTISAHVQKIQDSESELARNLARTTDYEIKVEQLESKCIGYSTEISQLKSMLLTTETNLKSAEDKTLKCKITCDSKLQTQQDIFKIVSQERDHFELELEKHRKSSTQLIEVQTSQIEKLQKENSKLVKEVEQKGKLQNEEHKKLMDTKKENADLKQEIKELQTKSTIKVTKHKISNRESCDLDQNGSMIDVPISFKSSVATGSKAPAPSSTITKKSKVQLGKRKKLLDDDHDDISLFGNFDFDSAIENQFPSLPRRYTKKKKN